MARSLCTVALCVTAVGGATRQAKAEPFFTILLEGARVENLRDPGSECELFVDVGGRHSGGETFSGVHPTQASHQGPGLQASRDGHWFNIREKRGPDTLLNYFIWRYYLRPGESTRVGLVFCDEGNGNLDSAKNAAAKAAAVVAANAESPITAAVGAIVATVLPLIKPNPTKTLGVVVVEATNSGGQLSWKVQPGKFVAEVENLAPAVLSDTRYHGGSWGGVRLKLRPQEENGVQGSDVDIFLRMILRNE